MWTAGLPLVAFYALFWLETKTVYQKLQLLISSLDLLSKASLVFKIAVINKQVSIRKLIYNRIVFVGNVVHSEKKTSDDKW